MPGTANRTPPKGSVAPPNAPAVTASDPDQQRLFAPCERFGQIDIFAQTVRIRHGGGVDYFGQ